MASHRDYGSEHGQKVVRKRPRDDYEDPPRKRGRYSDPGPLRGGREHEVSSEERLESLITRVGEKSQTSLENNLDSLSKVLITEITEFKDKILRTICKCVYSLTEKTSIYATLVGILNAKKFDFGEELLDMMVEELKGSLQLNQFNKAKQLVRFLSDLVNSKVVASASIITLFTTLLTVTYEPDIPQVRSDWYVNMVLSALPWAGAELEKRKSSAELDRLFTTLDNYMSKRTTPYLPAFQVWSSDRFQNDSLEVLWNQVRAMREKEWKDHILVRPYRGFDQVIGGAYTHSLPEIHVPSHSEDRVYPLPTVIFRLFTNDDLHFADPGSVLPASESIDRYLLEDAIMCILNSHETNRKECANALIALTDRDDLMPTSYIIVEVLFGLILCLPSPPQVLVYYSSVFIELCKSNPAIYPRILQQIIHLFFGCLDKMNMVGVHRLARWFAHHLSNYKFVWSWEEWSLVLQSKRDHPCACFIIEVFSRCIRLGFYEDFYEHIPKEFTTLLPPEPIPQFKYNSEIESPLPEAQVASKLIVAMRGKETIDVMLGIIDSLQAVIPELSLDTNKFLVTKVSVVTQCVLHVGCKTISHTFLALTKFRQLIMDTMKPSDHVKMSDQAKMACLEAVAEFYSCNTLLHTLILDKLVRMDIVDVMAILNWLFSEKVTPLFTNQYIWDILESTIQKTNRSHDQAVKALAETKDKLKEVTQLDEVACGDDKRKELEKEVEDLEEKKEECARTQKDMFLVICQRMTSVLTEHLSSCDQEEVDYETTWFLSGLDNFRQLLIKNYSKVSKYFSYLESAVFTSDVDPRIMEVFQQLQALL